MKPNETLQRWFSTIRPWSESLTEFLLPRGCAGCGASLSGTPRSRLVCASCTLAMKRAVPPRCPRCDLSRGTGRSSESPCLECLEWPTALTAVRSAVVLASPADHLVHKLKYEGWRELAAPMAERMSSVDLPLDPAAEFVIVPMPTTAKRIRARGYNQAALLAKEVAGRLNRPVVEALKRVHGTGSQVVLHPQERLANVRGAFAVLVSKRPYFRDKEVVLVDDVLTTGATLREAAGVLADAGARSVIGLTFTRAVPFRTES